MERTSSITNVYDASSTDVRRALAEARRYRRRFPVGHSLRMRFDAAAKELAKLAARDMGRAA